MPFAPTSAYTFSYKGQTRSELVALPLHFAVLARKSSSHVDRSRQPQVSSYLCMAMRHVMCDKRSLYKLRKDIEAKELMESSTTPAYHPPTYPRKTATYEPIRAAT
ncbi:hypothetical protein L202_02953 [Cryptococcus amylolentus CBS 6039]|uniref:Uncharacterized protein n=1 Tax=Cryptococcus amylolentus CBS 6039 TaxID=1295533 RepID=A0A1E3HWT8_9TREE|nr:hypothetical protein L202_02953 [Cryptococcus amylolentus CBS 6039]ODN80803.1 hypothetical protein L202_02953 [Cryptococcus amylolentus CBS 6039]